MQFGNKDYQSLYNIREAYRRAGGHWDTHAGNFNRFDNPGAFYFRIFFDFNKGLLDYLHDLGRTTKPAEDVLSDRNTYMANSALNYLMLNNEWERADMLREFIHLLSNINTYSPWYFSELDGLGELINRTEFTADTFQLPEIKPLTLKCLPDAYDNRIGTLIDLYRSICFSYQLHKEIVPANLRRFDMYVYIFPANTRGIHTLHKYIDNTNTESKEPVEDKFASFDQSMLDVDKTTGDVKNNSGKYITSSKLIYLSGCEIDLNASVSGYQNIKNDEGFAQEYAIPIKVRVAMEQRYNEHLMKRIGDFVVADMDLPNADGNYPNGNPGNIRKMNWGVDEADNAVKVTPTDSRLDVDLMRKGIAAPNPDDDTEYYDEYTKQKGSNLLGTSSYRDQNKTSLLDPWLNMGAQKADQLAGQVNQMVNAGKSALESWTDVSKLNQALVNGVDSAINRLMWGNMFESNLQDFASGVSDALSSMSSDNVINQATRRGWTHKDRTSPARPGQLQHNVSEQSNSPNGNYNPIHEVPNGNIFE